MSGNALEEGLMTQIGNPSHTDPSRIGFLAGAVPGFLIVIFLPVFMPVLTGFGALVIALPVTLVIGVLVTKSLQKRIKQREADRMAAMRETKRIETERQIAELKQHAH